MKKVDNDRSLFSQGKRQSKAHKQFISAKLNHFKVETVK